MRASGSAPTSSRAVCKSGGFRLQAGRGPPYSSGLWADASFLFSLRRGRAATKSLAALTGWAVADQPSRRGRRIGDRGGPAGIGSSCGAVHDQCGRRGARRPAGAHPQHPVAGRGARRALGAGDRPAVPTAVAGVLGGRFRLAGPGAGAERLRTVPCRA